MRERSVSPEFLIALGLMKVTTDETTVGSVSVSTSRDTAETDKRGARSTRISASAEVIRRPHKEKSRCKSAATASSTAKKTCVVKEEHVSKPRERAKKRTRAESIDKPQSIIPAPVVTKPATKVSSSAPKCTVKTAAAAESPSVLTSAADKVIFWSEIIHCDFKSTNFIKLLEKKKFSEEQIEMLKQSFAHLTRAFHRRPTKPLRFMKTYECIECNFSISHECLAIDTTRYWTFGGNAPCIHFIRPESTTMCACDFTIFHSHFSKSKSKRADPVPSCSPSTLPGVKVNLSVNLQCYKCATTLSMKNPPNAACADMSNFVSADGRVRKKFCEYVSENLEYGPKNSPNISEFFSCRNDCCVLFHRCAKAGIVRSPMPVQTHPPFMLAV
ncbi:c10.1 [Ichnoviriform fugitivi]|uniref:C10.1 n=1 Tax=Ichnoviriform fugitivi TaxID=265522 RepID=Q6PUP3_9VIRU|nr:c10.1 [Ichnoviriform fugitivi]AAS90272.1 c10.1 [Ichnoviriform fugitivi]